MKKNRLRNIIILISVLLLIVVSGIFILKPTPRKEVNEDGIIIKENVSVITPETVQPIAVTDNELIFNENPKYSEGDIIVAGIIDSAPSGFIRKVIGTEEQDNQYIVQTEPTVLTDVFEEAHVTKTFSVTEEGVSEINTNENSQTTDTSNTVGMAMRSYLVTNDIPQKAATPILLSDNKVKPGFSTDFDYDLADGISADGEFDVNIWLEVELDISRGDVVFSVIAHTETKAGLFIGASSDTELEFEKELLSKKLPNIQFNIGFVPIVITNELQLNLEGEAHVEGSLGTSYEISAKNSSGFRYDSKKNKLKEIKEKEYNSDGLQWKTAAKFSGGSSAGVFLHLITKLYDCTGADIYIGIDGNAEGEIIASPEKELNGLNYAGSMNLSIAPKLQGNLIVTVPIIDKKLKECPLFQITLKPFWERHWESSNDWKKDIEDLKPLELNHTYTTKFRDVNLISYPHLMFDYPDGWTVSYEEVTPYSEEVTLTNDSGVQINYLQGANPKYNMGYTYTIFAYRSDVSKVADSSFVPGYIQATDYSSLGKFVVAKVKVNGMLNRQQDMEYTDIDGDTLYTVLPESMIGSFEYIASYIPHEEFDFGYGSFTATVPEGVLTPKEEKEIIAILSSFRSEY